MEVAGVVLGAVPLIFYALDNYHRAWEPIRDTKNWKETIVTIRTQVQLQREQLKATLSVIDVELTEVTTMDEIEYALSISHPNSVETFMDSIRRMDDLMNELAKDLYPDVQGPPKMSDATSARMTWEWRRVKRSFGSKRRKEVYAQLQACNTALRNCGLEKRDTQMGTENRVVDHIKGRYDERTTKAIRENVRAMHEAIKSGLGCACTDQHHLGNFQLSWHENRPTRGDTFVLAMGSTPSSVVTTKDGTVSWKFLSMRVEEEKAITQQPVDPSPSSASSFVTQPSSQSSLSLPPAKSKGVRFREFFRSESKTSISVTGTTTTTSQMSSTTISSSVSTVVQSRSPSPQPPAKLCDLIQDAKDSGPALMPVPGSQPSKQIRVAALGSSRSLNPADIKHAVQLQALLERVKDAATNRRLGLDRKQRFGIATALVWAVLNLCDSPWMTEAIQGDAVHLFLEQDGHDHPHLSSHPYLSHNFMSTPLTNDRSGSTANFQEKQIQNMTLYTLAIRLIELGANKSFERLRRDYGASFPTHGDDPIDDHEVAKWQIEELSLDPGPSYAGAVEKCLRFIFPGPTAMHTFEHKSFRSTFFECVIAPIQATYELIPASYSQIV